MVQESRRVSAIVQRKTPRHFLVCLIIEQKPVAPGRLAGAAPDSSFRHDCLRHQGASNRKYTPLLVLSILTGTWFVAVDPATATQALEASNPTELLCSVHPV